MLCSPGLLHLSAMESGYSSEALPSLLQSSRVIPQKPPREDPLNQANAIPGSGLVTHSLKCHGLAKQKDIFIDVSYICMDDFAGIFTFLTARIDLAYKPIMLFCFHYYKPVRNSMRFSVSCGEYSKSGSTPQRS